jgi:glycosyltransferase involved in cell wall biosynthesis
MHIALNARHLLADRLEGVGVVTDEVMRRIALQHPEDKLDYYFDRKYDHQFVHGPNVSPFVLFPPTRLPILLRFWLNRSVRRHIVQRKPDVFFSPDGFIPLGMAIPKVSMVHDAAFLRHPEFLQTRTSKFYKVWMPRYLAYADHIITVSEFSKRELMEGYDLPDDKISVVYNGISEIYHPVPEEKRIGVREQLTNGRPYFVYLGSIHPRKNIPVLIKAYERFREQTGADHHLVLAGRLWWMADEVKDAVSVSPYISDIHFPGYITSDRAVALLGGATAMIYPSRYEGFGLPLLEGMACGTPVIASNTSSLPEVAGDAALLFDPDQPDELAHHMATLIADASLRDQLVERGFRRCSDFSWDTSASEIYNILRRFSGK